MLVMAMEYIRGKTAAPVRGMVADFLRDADKLAVKLRASRHQKLILCLGNTAGNFSQREMFCALRSLLQGNDRLLLGLGLYEAAHADQELQALGDLFSSAANCRFGLRFLAACGGRADHRLTFARAEDDPEEEGVKVVRLFYRFPKDTALTVGAHQVDFARDEVLQWVESRRYPKGRVEEYLAKHGLKVVAQRTEGNHGIFLTCLGSRPGKRLGGVRRKRSFTVP
jgi:uncharacterized SAM-dependent methyltransferase